MKDFYKNFLFVVEDPEKWPLEGRPELRLDANRDGEKMTLRELYVHYLKLCNIAEKTLVERLIALSCRESPLDLDFESLDIANYKFPQGKPARHGRWVDNGIPGSILNGCSICGFPCGAFTFKFCPQCGARMDGKENKK